MVMVDTSVWIDFFNGQENPHTTRLDDLLSHEIVLIGDIILAEILQGFKSDFQFNEAKKALDSLTCLSICNKEMAIKSAENYRFLRGKGVTVRKTTDMLIGTFCIEHHLPLLFSDRDFQPLADFLDLIPA